MKNISLRIYLAKNLGDDIFLKVISERYPNVLFHTCPTLKYKRTYIPNNVIMYDGKIQILRNKILHKLKIYTFDTDKKICKKCEATVIAGGSIFHEPPTWKYTRKKLEMFNNLNKDYYILGCNFGPYESNDFLTIHKKIIANSKDTCFRDRKSWELFKNFSNTRHQYDIAFSLNREKDGKINNKEKYVVISAIDLTWRQKLKHKTEIYESTMSKIANYYLENGITVFFMVFSKHEGDEKAIDRIMSSIDEKYAGKMRKYIYDGDVDDALSIIKNADTIVASRFHANILGILYERKIIPVIYDIKTTNLLKDIGYKGEIIDINNLAHIFSVNNVIQNCKKNNYTENLSDIIKSSNLQFRELDKYLKDKQ